ncbi:hypothetical protein [Giesbergeria giesbergeri]
MQRKLLPLLCWVCQAIAQDAEPRVVLPLPASQALVHQPGYQSDCKLSGNLWMRSAPWAGRGHLVLQGALHEYHGMPIYTIRHQDKDGVGLVVQYQLKEDRVRFDRIYGVRFSSDGHFLDVRAIQFESGDDIGTENIVWRSDEVRLLSSKERENLLEMIKFLSLGQVDVLTERNAWLHVYHHAGESQFKAETSCKLSNPDKKTEQDPEQVTGRFSLRSESVGLVRLQGRTAVLTRLQSVCNVRNGDLLQETRGWIARDLVSGHLVAGSVEVEDSSGNHYGSKSLGKFQVRGRCTISSPPSNGTTAP